MDKRPRTIGSFIFQWKAMVPLMALAILLLKDWNQGPSQWTVREGIAMACGVALVLCTLGGLLHEWIKADRDSQTALERFETSITRFDEITRKLEETGQSLTVHADESNAHFAVNLREMTGVTSELKELAKMTNRMAYPMDEIVMRWNISLEFERPLEDIPIVTELLDAADQLVERGALPDYTMVFSDELQGPVVYPIDEMHDRCPMFARHLYNIDSYLNILRKDGQRVAYHGGDSMGERTKITEVAVSRRRRLIHLDATYKMTALEGHINTVDNYLFALSDGEFDVRLSHMLFETGMMPPAVGEYRFRINSIELRLYIGSDEDGAKGYRLRFGQENFADDRPFMEQGDQAQKQADREDREVHHE